jgi:small-conductance mechanosensitive channel
MSVGGCPRPPEAEAMQDIETEEAEQLKYHEDVKAALKQTGAKDAGDGPVAKPRDRMWFSGYVFLLIGFGAFHYLVAYSFFGLSSDVIDLLQRIARVVMLVVFILGIARASEVYLIGSIDNAVSRYNLKRIQRLVVILIVAFISVSLLFVNWYTAAVSLGLISLIVGFALQGPITSFIGWIYLMVRAPYRVGDRIKIGDATGDVIDVSYLDTTLWEFGGSYLSTDHPTGRIVRFPNSEVLRSAVYNYTWPLFPYVWNEIKFNIAYESDLEFVATSMQQIAEEEVGELMMERIRVYRRLLAQTPVDELQVREHPAVLFRISENTWLEAIVRYLVHPKEAGRVKTRLIKKLLATLTAAPDRVLFPKSNAR